MPTYEREWWNRTTGEHLYRADFYRRILAEHAPVDDDELPPPIAALIAEFVPHIVDTPILCV